MNVMNSGCIFQVGAAIYQWEHEQKATILCGKKKIVCIMKSDLFAIVS